MPQVHPYVKEIIASTNGIHYTDKVNNIFSYPVYNLPVDKANYPDSLMLDIGCGWGRWLVAGSKKDYIPIGVDLRLKMCQVSQYSLKEQGVIGYNVVGDLQYLPFQDNIFDLIWSFSVIQHTHKEKLLSCLSSINNLLKKDGFAYLEFPNKNGIRNRLGEAQKWEKYRDVKSGDHHMHVRYYSIQEYRAFFEKEFGNFTFNNHSFLGIGVLKDDLKYVSIKNKILCSISLIGSGLTKIIPGLKYLSDSIYIKTESNIESKPVHSFVKDFILAHKKDPHNNLNIVPLLKCPKSNKPLVIQGERLIVPDAQLFYPIIDNIPVLLPSEARSL